MAAFLFIAHKRKLRERIDDLQLSTLAAKGKPQAVKDQVTQWQREV